MELDDSWVPESFRRGMADAKTGEIIAFSRMSNAESFGDKFVDQTEEVYGKALNKQFERLRIGMYLDKKKH